MSLSKLSFTFSVTKQSQKHKFIYLEKKKFHLFHPSILSLPAKLKVPKPQIYIAFKPRNSELENLGDSGHAGIVRNRHFHLLFSLGLELTRHRFLPESAERVELSLVLDVGQVVLLERARPFQTVLVLAALLHDLGDLAASEDFELLEVVELVHHALQPVMHHVSHVQKACV